MLQQLIIKNIAIIDELEMSFAPGLSVITGETGAGKSIIINALDLVLGGRASTEAIRSGQDKARVEALFDLSRRPDIMAGAIKSGLDEEAEDGHLVLKRQLAQAGKSSGYVNGSLVPLWELERVGQGLVDIHGQHQHQLLLNPAAHVDFLDAVGGVLPKRQELAELYRQWQERRAELARLEKLSEAKRERRQLLEFQAQEIDQAGLKENEDEELAAERKILLNAGKLTEYGGFVYQSLYESEGAVLDMLAQAQDKLRQLGHIDPVMLPQADVIESASCQLQEVAMEMSRYLSRVEHNPERLQMVEDRLAELEKLMRKYGSPLSRVLDFRRQVATDLEGLGAQDEQLGAIAGEIRELSGQLNALAAEISARRREAGVRLEGAMSAELGALGMPKARFCCRITAIPAQPDSYAGNENGLDDVEFLFSANPGEPPRPLAKVASGGELSRIMLAMKTLIAGGDKVPTLVFDEVDTGIGGSLAATVGRKLKALAGSHQIICITHLPQIASLADHHYTVTKSVSGDRTQTHWKKLDGQERIEELARMLAGEEITDTARQHAREMLAQLFVESKP